MIFFVTTASHRYTHRAVAAARRGFRCVTYPELFARRRLPQGAYIFSDFDRLGFYQLELAAHVYRALHASGCRVLNDPARALQRLGLLRQLYRTGINSFRAWPAADELEVDRFPVFVRTASAHRGNLTELLADGRELAAALERLLREGYPLVDLIVVEYRAEPIHDDIFRKLSVYRVGQDLITSPSVHERNWTAKYGQEGVANRDTYRDDLALVRSNPYADAIRAAFDAAHIEYGRADFGIVKGRPEIYEINTNPMMHGLSDHAVADRYQAKLFSHTAYHIALDRIDQPRPGGSVRVLRPESFRPKARILRLIPGYQWLP